MTEKYISVPFSESAIRAVHFHREAVRDFEAWKRLNPEPAFERAKEAHALALVEQREKVAEAEKRLIGALERDARGR